MNVEWKRPGWAGAVAAALLVNAMAAEKLSPGAEVAVIYNREGGSASKEVAEHYAKSRGVPASQLIGLKLPTGENMTRREFREDFQRPLVKVLEDRGLVKFSEPKRDLEAALGRPRSAVTESRIRYLVLGPGIPLRVTPEPKLDEAIIQKLAEPLRRNGAAVDNELAALPLLAGGGPLTGPLKNPAYGATNASALHPTNGLFLVARLDGPTTAIARGLVDKALEAERNGLWGRAYFDARGLTNGPYLEGDRWMRQAYAVASRQGFESYLDERPGLFPGTFPMPQIALYAGWYETSVSGPFTREPVEFMPGAVAYHLHSFSARSLRTPAANWVGPFLAQGVTATLGCTDEPYLDLSPQIGLLFADLLQEGMSFGEAAYAAQPVLSWQTTVVGDPLYRPMSRPPQAQHEALERSRSPLLEWSHLKVVNLNLVGGASAREMIDYLSGLELTRQSAVLTEKLGDLLRQDGKPAEAIERYFAALKLKPSRNERIQLQLKLLEHLLPLGRQAEGLEVFETFFAENPNYPQLLLFYRQALTVAKQARDEKLAAKYEREVLRLTPPPPPSTNAPAPAGAR